MTSLYGSTLDKQRGIEREPIVAERIHNYFLSNGIHTIMEKASKYEDMHKKFDRKYTCNINESFRKEQQINELKIDIKCAKTFTLIDNNGHNTLTNSESTYIVFELYPNAEKLLWVSTKVLKEYIQKFPPVLLNSKEHGNNSQYFLIEKYIMNNKTKFEGYYKYI
jgi:hypothetical protein